MSDGCSSRLESANKVEKPKPRWRFFMWSAGEEVFDIPTVASTVVAKTSSGPLFPELQAIFPDMEPIDRTYTNAWEDEHALTVV